MRIAFTIVLNNIGLLQKQVEQGIHKNFDKWVIIEGAADNKGSTSWCKEFPRDYIYNGKSTDGTHEYLREISHAYKNIYHVFKVPEECYDIHDNKLPYDTEHELWRSKDEMVNAFTSYLDEGNEYYIWQVDVDEFWDKDTLTLAEYQLEQSKAKCASFLCNYFVGNRVWSNQLVVKGGWGEGNTLRYNRLWKWQYGDEFISHEHPIITGQTPSNTITLPYIFNHYSYTDIETVRFKDSWYGGHEGVFNNWLELDTYSKDRFPVPITHLLPENNWVDDNTQIHWVDQASFILYIQWFKSDNDVRNKEIVRSIERNAKNPYITEIYIFAESKFECDIPKVKIINLGRRMTYLDCFQHIKYVLNQNSYCIIANSDIIIPEETTAKLNYQDKNLDNTFIALSRYEYEKGKISFIGHDMAYCSQDTWIFKAEDINMDYFNKSNFYLGVCSCDNIIARLAHDSGMRVINPSLYLKTIHLHESRYRTYTSQSGYYAPILFVPATDNFEETPDLTITHSVWEKPIYIW